jgi:hypothetical protein
MSQTKEPFLKGSCQCGAVTYTSTCAPPHVTNCHCTTCRKISGAPFIPFGDYPITAVAFHGPLTKTSYSKMAERTHCAKCGTPISMWYKLDPDSIAVTMGSIDEDTVKGELPSANKHIFLKEKAMWYVLPDDGLERYETFPKNFQKMIDEWKGSGDSKKGKE